MFLINGLMSRSPGVNLAVGVTKLSFLRQRRRGKNKLDRLSLESFLG
jgi:hypothetical protein